MSFIYVPVMSAKRGEFTALMNLVSSMSDKVAPLFELPAKKSDATLYEKAIARTATGAGKAWNDRLAFLDISKWSSNARTESGVHILEYSFSQFVSSGVNVHPVIGYDRWEDPAYSQALQNIHKNYDVKPCIRLDRETVQDDMLDYTYFSERIDDIMTMLSLEPSDCYVMVDFGNTATTSVPDMITDTERAITTLRSLGFETIVVVGGSMPSAVNEAVDTPDAEGCIPRIEMMAWKAVFTGIRDKNVIFGDYLIRNAVAAEGVIALHANAKIRYTIENQYFIVRGHSKKIDTLRLQHRNLAEKLVTSAHYMGPTFSWGDSEILNCSIGLREIRDATLMIAVDSNHHIGVVVLEILEHQRQVELLSH